jgi:hypothetical protein
VRTRMGSHFILSMFLIVLGTLLCDFSIPAGGFGVRYYQLNDAVLVQYDWGIAGRAAVDQDNLYYAITGGSSTHAVFISTNVTGTEGYLVNGILAEYILCDFAPHGDGYYGDGGLFKWNSTIKDWTSLFVASIQNAPYETVYHSANGEVEVGWGEGRVSLSALGNPKRVWLVFEALETTKIRTPHNGFAYIDVENKVGAAFVVQKPMSLIPHPTTEYPPEPQEWVVNRNETVRATLLLRNYGSQAISVSSWFELPSNISVVNGGTAWNFTILPLENANATALISGTDLGIFDLSSWITYQGLGPFELIQKMAVVPRIEARMEAPDKVNYGQQCQVNITVKNLEPVPATVTLSPSFGIGASTVSVALDGSSEITIEPTITVEYSSLAYDISFQDIRITTCGASTNVTYPEGYILDVTLNSITYLSGYVTMHEDTLYNVQVQLENAGDFAFTATLSLEVPSDALQTASIATSKYFAADRPETSVTLDSKSNGTISFRLFALKADGAAYRELHLSVSVGDYPIDGKSITFEFIPETEPWFAVILKPEVLLFAALAFVLGALLAIGISRAWFYRKRRPATSSNILSMSPLLFVTAPFTSSFRMQGQFKSPTLMGE